MYSLAVIFCLLIVATCILIALATIAPYIGAGMFLVWPFIAVGFFTEIGSLDWWIAGSIGTVAWLSLISWISHVTDPHKRKETEDYDDWLKKHGG